MITVVLIVVKKKSLRKGKEEKERGGSAPYTQTYLALIHYSKSARYIEYNINKIPIPYPNFGDNAIGSSHDKAYEQASNANDSNAIIIANTLKIVLDDNFFIIVLLLKLIISEYLYDNLDQLMLIMSDVIKMCATKERLYDALDIFL